MPTTVNWEGRQYIKHEHIANWKVLKETLVYYKPYTDSKIVYDGKKLQVNSIHVSGSKTTINEVPWYYFGELGGWVPWKTSTQIIKRDGIVVYCEGEGNNTKEDNNTKAPVVKETVPKISELLNSNSEEYKDFLRAHMMIKEDSNLWTSKFNRVQFADPYHAIGTTREYLFFVKPDLHIFKPSTVTLNEELSNDPFWIEMQLRYRRVIRQLQLSADNTTMPFMPLLSNAVADSLDLPSSNGETSETGQTVYGTTIQYRQGSFKSDEGFDFSLEFHDNPSLEVYHLFKMYNEYENLKTLGIVTPPAYGSSAAGKSLNRYIVDRILHDQMGIFKIIVEDDMETILHYSYLWGCFPKSVPRDTFREVEPGLIKYSIDWHAQFVDDMQPEILIDFNALCGQYINPKSDTENCLWNNSYKNGSMINGRWPGCPYITISPDKTRPTGYRYKLKWFDRK